MSGAYVMMVHKKEPRYIPLTRKGRAVVQGMAPHDARTLHPDEASAIRAFDGAVKALRRKGFHTLDEHNAKKAKQEEEAAARPERDRRKLLESSKHLEVKKLGTLVLTKGFIAACDPLSCEKPSPFARRMPKGSYDVFVALAKLPITGRSKWRFDIRCAAAFVRFAKGAVVRFEPATTKPRRRAQRPSSAYGVDAGTGCFLDPDQLDELDEPTREEITTQLLQKRPPTFDYAFLPASGTGSKLVAFTSGFGDGVYACFWGLSKSNKRIVLLTDFGVVDV